MIDQHVHTVASPDASEAATCEAYAKRRLSAVTFTDHVDFSSPVPLFDTFPDFDKLFRAKNTLNASDAGTSFGVGVELGWQRPVEDDMRTLVLSRPFDLVIMSLHAGDGLDFHNGDFFKRYGRKKGVRRYFELVLESLETYTDFDVYGHIDYISRYVPGEPRDYDYETHKDIIDKILRRLVELDKAIEINTSAHWKYGLDDFNPKPAVLKRFHDLGGRKVTVGSDAHDPKDAARDMDAAKETLRRAGFTQFCHYVNRTCRWVSL